LAVFLLAGCLTDEHEVGGGVADAEDHLSTCFRERTHRARESGLLELGERCERSGFGTSRLLQGHSTRSEGSVSTAAARERRVECYATAARTASAVAVVVNTRNRSKCASTSPVATAN